LNEESKPSLTIRGSSGVRKQPRMMVDLPQSRRKPGQNPSLRMMRTLIKINNPR
jgi:hypothetical protein